MTEQEHRMSITDETGERFVHIFIEDGDVTVSTEVMEQIAENQGATVSLNVKGDGSYPDTVVVAWIELHEVLLSLGFRDVEDEG